MKKLNISMQYKGGAKMHYQQGDILIEVIEKTPKEMKKLPHLTLAYGEVTGHHHTITEGKAELYEEKGIMFLRVNSENAILTHQEHNTVIIPKGDYVVRRVREKDWLSEEIRNVRD